MNSSAIPTDLAHYKSIAEWTPQVGDFLIWHGWLTHWFGVICGVSNQDHTVTVIKKGIPILLLTLDQGEYEKNREIIPAARIRRSVSGKYTAQRAIGNNIVWYI